MSNLDGVRLHLDISEVRLAGCWKFSSLFREKDIHYQIILMLERVLIGTVIGNKSCDILKPGASAFVANFSRLLSKDKLAARKACYSRVE